MNTLEMMIEAKGTEKVFRHKDLYYRESVGFTDKELKPWEGNMFDYLNELFELSNWKEVVGITGLEKDILRSINQGYKYIARDEDGTLCVYREEPLTGRWTLVVEIRKIDCI